MKIRRRRGSTPDTPVCQMLSGDQWIPVKEVPEFCLQQGPDREAVASTDCLLPFQPLSFRDFMLYESHVINATRGYVRRFMPAAYKVATAYEAVTRTTFPAFRPGKLWYQQPIYYMSNHLAFVPSGTPLTCPSYSNALDYELELGAVLGKPLFNATPEEALAAIGGFVVLNDVSARDVQRREMESGFGPQKAKHFCNSMSDVLVTADEILPHLDNLKASIAINNKEVVSTSTAGMFHSLGEAIAHASRDEHLFPGELFGTGTLPGGSGIENGHWLKPGDTVQLKIDLVGEINHEILEK